jgi:integration host factor subunit beta
MPAFSFSLKPSGTPFHASSNGESMNKSELIKSVADQSGIPMEEAAMVVHTMMDCMKDALLRGDRVEIRGFGSFKVKEYGAYAGRNPRTGDKVAVHPKRLPFFRAGKELKVFLNE